MGIRARTRSFSTVRPRRIRKASFLCLFALIAQVLLPVIHSFQVVDEELSSRIFTLTACSYHERASEEAQALTSGPKEAPKRSHHDCCSCPICQYLFCTQNLLVQDQPPGSLVFESIELLPLVHQNPKTTLCCLGTCSPRSPPLA